MSNKRPNATRAELTLATFPDEEECPGYIPAKRNAVHVLGLTGQAFGVGHVSTFACFCACQWP